MTPRETLVLGASDVASLLPMDGCIASVEHAMTLHERGRSLPPASLGLSPAGGSFHVKAAGLAVDDDVYVVAKANMNLPGNPSERGLPTIQGVLLLFDGRTGEPLAVMDSIVVTAVRTAAVAAVAARHLARPAAHTLTIAGCGAQGVAQLRAMTRVLPIRRAFAFDTVPERARAYAAAMTRELAVEVQPVDDLPQAISRSDVCITCTTSTTAFLGPEHLHPGLFIAAVGADNPHKQEIAPQAMAAARVVVDSLDACSASGDLRHALAAGVMSAGDVHGELSAVVAGTIPGRSTDHQVFIFDSTGTALQDVAAAVVVYRSAIGATVGTRVALGRA